MTYFSKNLDISGILYSFFFVRQFEKESSITNKKALKLQVCAASRNSKKKSLKISQLPI